MTDARGDVTSYAYDGHDRLWTTTYPSAAPHGVTSEQYGYDPAGNRTTITNRAGETTAFEYDALNRVTLKNRPGTELDISYTYDNFGRVKRARDTNAFWGGYRLNYTYDAFGRVTSEGNIPHGTRRFDYDLAGRRTRITHADGHYFDYDYHVTGEVKTIRENGATSGPGLLATYQYDPNTDAGQLGAITGILFGNGTSRSFTYNAPMQLQSLGIELPGTSHDLTLGFGYNPAGQIVSNTRSNEIYSTNRHYNTNRPYAVNALNQYTDSGDLKPSYDARGNMISAGTATTYGYDSENRLVTAPNHNFGFDPVGRLNYSWNNNEGYDYEGQHLIVERSGTTGPIRRRYVHGPGLDAPIVWYEGSGLTDRRFLQADERGSVIAVTDSNGAVIGTNNYDEYGIPGTANIGRFQYTGQMWMWELGMYHYKARIYSPTHGRFLQTDPIGYGDGMNMYGYVGADPVNRVDPSGARAAPSGVRDELEEFAGSGRVWDWMGMGARLGGGRLEAAAYEKQQSELASAGIRLQWISAKTGIGAGCLLSAACTDFAIFAASGYTLGNGWVYGEVGTAGLPFYALRVTTRLGAIADTKSFTRQQAFRSAKFINGVPNSAQPLRTYLPDTPAGRAVGLISGTNGAYFVYRNMYGQLVGIREDFSTAWQPRHFNSGPVGDVNTAPAGLPNHHYWGVRR